VPSQKRKNSRDDWLYLRHPAGDSGGVTSPSHTRRPAHLCQRSDHVGLSRRIRPEDPQHGEVVEALAVGQLQRRVLDTGDSFSVSARVKLLDKGGTQAVVSQDGFQVSGFALQYDAAEDRWSMGLRDADSRDAQTDVAPSKSTPKAGTWTHLTGSTTTPTMRSGSLSTAGSKTSPRTTETGRRRATSRSAGAAGRRPGFQGLRRAVDDVRAFDRTLSAREARALADANGAWRHGSRGTAARRAGGGRKGRGLTAAPRPGLANRRPR
jgi:hypothetical protein